LIVSPTPSYLLYESLAQIQGARFQTVPYHNWSVRSEDWPIGTHLTFLANPNSPTGTFIDSARLRNWPGPLVIDEAYADFADRNCLALVGGTTLVSRTLSKSYGLAGIRFGFGVAEAGLIREFNKVKDSYNCDVLSLAAATAAIADQEYMNQTRVRIRSTRTRLTSELRGLGFTAFDSQANFVWSQRADRPVKPLYEALKQRQILVRYMNYPGFGDGLRISVGTDVEIDRLLTELRTLL
jgi:histidinol-phosphate aminotransferase